MMWTKAEAVGLLLRRIDESGLSTTCFAREVMRRDRRTVGRWLSGDSPIPQIVLDWLQDPTAAPWPESSTADLRERMQDTGVCDVCGAPDLNRGG